MLLEVKRNIRNAISNNQAWIGIVKISGIYVDITNGQMRDISKLKWAAVGRCNNNHIDNNEINTDDQYVTFVFDERSGETVNDSDSCGDIKFAYICERKN